MPWVFATRQAPTIGTPKSAVERWTGTWSSSSTTFASLSVVLGWTTTPLLVAIPAIPTGTEPREGPSLRGYVQGTADGVDGRVGELGVDERPMVVREDVVAGGVLAAPDHGHRRDRLEEGAFLLREVVPDDEAR